MSSASHGSSSIQGFRPDIEGLRAIAVIMVLLYHLDIGWASGGFAGVDVFFVISGFLITGLLAKEVEKTGRVSLLDFYARRAKRLFPAAALVLAATAALTVWLLPRTRWQDIGGDIVASAAYLINWRLAARSVDYLAEDAVPSPVQHFWSLAVEEQYYIVWPVVLVAALWMVRGRIKPTSLLLGVTAAVGIPSLVYSILHTASSPATAYFITTTRMWELAIGAAVALLAPRLSRLPGAGAQVLGWTGVAGLAATLLLISTKTPWPGYFAAIPTLSTAAVIAAGFAAGPRGPVALLGTRAMCWIGGISYSLYLWHWPLIQFAKVKWGAELPLVVAAGAAATSVALAWVTLRLVENPIRFSERMRDNARYALSTGINFSLAGVVFGLCVMLALSFMPAGGHSPSAQTPTDSAAEDDAGGPAPLGALALTMESADDPALLPVDSFPRIVPAPERATADVPRAYEDGCQLPYSESKPKSDCFYGKPDGKLRISVLGDSKVVQWLPALERLAMLHDWRIQVHAKSACGFHDLPLKQYDGKPYVTCTEWNKAVIPLLLGEQKPDVIFTSMGSGLGVADEKEIAALRARWELMARNGIKVIAMANNPSPGGNAYECVAEHSRSLSTCSFPVRPASGTASMEAAAKLVPGTMFINLNDSICGRRVCSAVIGGVLVYRQGSHLTRTYIESLTPRLEKALLSAGFITDLKLQSPDIAKNLGVASDRTLRSPPFGLVIPFRHNVSMDRVETDAKGTQSRRIRFEYQEGSRDEILDQMAAALSARSFRKGPLHERENGAARVSFSRSLDNARLMMQVEPYSSTEGGNSVKGGSVYMSIPVEPEPNPE